MRKLESRVEVIEQHLGKPVLVTQKAYRSNSRELVPCYVKVGILTRPIERSLWVFGPALIVKPHPEMPPEFQIYSLMGNEYVLQSVRMEACIYSTGQDMARTWGDEKNALYIFTPDSDGLELISNSAEIKQ